MKGILQYRFGALLAGRLRVPHDTFLRVRQVTRRPTGRPHVGMDLNQLNGRRVTTQFRRPVGLNRHLVLLRRVVGYLITRRRVGTNVNSVRHHTVTTSRLSLRTLAHHFFTARFRTIQINVSTGRALQNRNLTRMLRQLTLTTANIRRGQVNQRQLARRPTRVVSYRTRRIILPNITTRRPRARSNFFSMIITRMARITSLTRVSRVAFGQHFTSLAGKLHSSRTWPTEVRTVVQQVSNRLTS